MKCNKVENNLMHVAILNSYCVGKWNICMSLKIPIFCAKLNIRNNFQKFYAPTVEIWFSCQPICLFYHVKYAILMCFPSVFLPVLLCINGGKPYFDCNIVHLPILGWN